MIVKQLSVFLQNEAGRILELTDVLGKAKVNIEALSVAETGEYGMVRMIAGDIEKASSVPNRDKVATVSKAQVQEIAELKMEDLNAASLEAAMRMIEGTARSMGILVGE